MGAPDKFCWKWNDFESNISLAFRELREEKDFFDVTLACDDSQVQAHKVILSACSSFFRNVLRRNPHQHPLLYLKGVKYKDILSVLNFMYLGEVNVAQDELKSFLAVALDLRVKGLTHNGSGAGESFYFKHLTKPREPLEGEPVASAAKRPRVVLSTTQSFQTADDDIQEVLPVESEPREPAPKTIVAPEEQSKFYQHPQQVHVEERQTHGTVALDESYADENHDHGQKEGYDNDDGTEVIRNSSMASDPTNVNKSLSDYDVTSTLEHYVKKLPTGEYLCCLCNYQASRRHHITNHIEAKHMQSNFSYHCDICSKVCPTKNALNAHMSRKHKTLNLLE